MCKRELASSCCLLVKRMVRMVVCHLRKACTSTMVNEEFHTRTSNKFSIKPEKRLGTCASFTVPSKNALVDSRQHTPGTYPALSFRLATGNKVVYAEAIRHTSSLRQRHTSHMQQAHQQQPLFLFRKRTKNRRCFLKKTSFLRMANSSALRIHWWWGISSKATPFHI